ncbi:MAG: hypothetical protein NZM11_02280 [Anaerolineales bacterium]|nr:hypothetical protein [Anaerolineales bacterium]
MSRREVESQLEQLASALKTMPLSSEAAWDRVWAQMKMPRQVNRWPLALSMSLVAATFAVANVVPIRYHHAPTLRAAYLPAPVLVERTPTPLGWTAPAVSGATAAPPLRFDVAPVPRPPGS